MSNKKNKKMNSLFKAILSVFILILISNNICFAGAVPKFNPKDPNQKPGLYRLDNMHNRRYNHKMTILNDGKVFISGTDEKYSDGKAYKTAEIFDLETGKFKEVNTLFIHNSLGHKSVLMSNGNVLLSCGYEKKVTQDKTKGHYEVYDPVTDKFYEGPESNLICSKSVFLENSDDGNIIAYGEAKIDGKIKTVFEKYNVKSNTVSDIEKYNTSDYDPYFRKTKNADKMFQIVEENIGHPRYCIAFFDGNSLFAATTQVDYGINISDITDGRLSYQPSWFSPLYITNENKISIAKINEYSRSWKSTGIKLKDKNMILITGGLYPSLLLYNPDIDPKDMPLKERIFWAAGNPSRSAYILVY